MRRAMRELSADCARCEGLCCVSLPFERGRCFSFDKPADVPCRHLLANDRCEVHAARRARGLGGCANYDCYGAGQRVTHELFGGRSWRADAQLARRICAAFRTLATVHELLLLLREASRLPLDQVQTLELGRLVEWLEPPEGRGAAAWLAFDAEHARATVRGFLRGLRDTPAAPRRFLPLAPGRE
jgi:hypothetical protein